MFRSLLNGLPTAGVFGVIMGITIVASAAAAYLVSVVAPNFGQTNYENVSTAIKAVFALLYGLIFALSMGGFLEAPPVVAALADERP